MKQSIRLQTNQAIMSFYDRSSLFHKSVAILNDRLKKIRLVLFAGCDVRLINLTIPERSAQGSEADISKNMTYTFSFCLSVSERESP